ncbi:MAG: hypothetical protein ACOYK9_01400 [Chlamydiia bacterium]
MDINGVALFAVFSSHKKKTETGPKISGDISGYFNTFCKPECNVQVRQMKGASLAEQEMRYNYCMDTCAFARQYLLFMNNLI